MIAPQVIPNDILHFAGSCEAAWSVLDVFKALPDRFQEPVKSRYSREAMEGGREAAKSYISRVEQELCGAGLSLAASDSEICDYAKARADEVRSLLMAQTGAGTADDQRAVLVGYCVEFGATVPPGVLLAGLCGRMTEAAWWRRQIRRNMARQVEAHAIGLGFVHRRAGLYASDDAVQRHGEQQARNRAALEATEATNEEGLTMTLAELSAVSVANPRLRRGELMTRIAGFESFAKAAGHVGMFYTGTAPSCWHARMAKTGQKNPHYDEETTPKQCAGYLGKTFAKARAWLHRRGIHIYGFRVAEPHHDGTPHWHMLFFMAAEVVESVTYCLRRYFSEADAHELNTEKAAKARFDAVKIDWKRGSAAGYISKYIAKNIDGSKNDLSSIGQAHDETEEGTFEVGEADKTAPRVLAWASTWGIRQFQQIGGPGVTVWRELRRLREGVQGDLFRAWSAADVGNWHAYIDAMGGVKKPAVWYGVEQRWGKPSFRNEYRTVKKVRRVVNRVCSIKRLADKAVVERAWPVQLWKEAEEGKRNRYGEEAGAEIKGVRMGDEVTITRLHQWEIRRGGKCSITADIAEKAGTGGKACAARDAAEMGGQRSPLLPLTLGAWRPWSPVNNCTPPQKDADGLDIGAFSEPEPPPPISEAMRAKIKAAEVAAILDNIAAKQKRGGFGQFRSFSTFQRGSNEIRT